MGTQDDVRALHEHYELGLEQDRLTSPRGVLEFERSKELILRHLPPTGSVIADIGGGPGRYALWLASLGYRVRHRDLVPVHVDQLSDIATTVIETAVGDACELDLDDESVDAVLLLGPLYHLRTRTERVEALTEARRVVRPGGVVFAAAISRWAPRLDGILASKLYEFLPAIVDEIDRFEHDGWMPPLAPGAFFGFCHRPVQLRSEVRAAGLTPVALVSVEGLAVMLPDLAERLDESVGREVVFQTARATESIPELLGLGPHLMITARRPEAVVN
ncbi:MAG: class I SAM-dependent methyltransferase [Acidimicrobiia bacterium]